MWLYIYIYILETDSIRALITVLHAYKCIHFVVSSLFIHLFSKCSLSVLFRLDIILGAKEITKYTASA